MYKACYMQFMYGGSTVSPYTGEVPPTGYMVGRSALAEPIFVQSVSDPAMGAMDLPQIQVSAIKNLKQHTLRSKMYVGTWENKQGSTEVDISQRFDELEDALDKCRLLGEKCVWDLANNEEIYV